jgi:hypothetical protein
MSRKLVALIAFVLLLSPGAARAQDKPGDPGTIDGRLSNVFHEATQTIRHALGTAVQTIVDLPKDVAAWPEAFKYLYDERAAIMEYDGGLDRKTAEQKAEEAARAQWQADNKTKGLPANVADWPEGYRYLYEERAGIMEFDGNMPRAQAETAAEVIVRDTYLSDMAGQASPSTSAPAPTPADLTRNLPARKGPGISQILERSSAEQKDEAGEK